MPSGKLRVFKVYLYREMWNNYKMKECKKCYLKMKLVREFAKYNIELWC